MLSSIKYLLLPTLAILLLLLPQISIAAPVAANDNDFMVAAYDNPNPFNPRAYMSSKKVGNICWRQGGGWVFFGTYNNANCHITTWSGRDCRGSNMAINFDANSYRMIPVSYGSVEISCH